jgi:hypothetical protein
VSNLERRTCSPLYLALVRNLEALVINNPNMNTAEGVAVQFSWSWGFPSLTRIRYLFIIRKEDCVNFLPSLCFCLTWECFPFALQDNLYIPRNAIHRWCNRWVAIFRCLNMRIQFGIRFQKSLASLTLVNGVVFVQMASVVATPISSISDGAP